jgi:ribose 5-phosphate isomerase A
MSHEREKELAALAAAEVVEPGMEVGLGTGSTVAYLLPALAARRIDIHCVATSVETARLGRELGLLVDEFSGPDAPSRLDVAIDGADQVTRAGWLVKGGGRAHTREKAVAAAAGRFLVIISSDKLVEHLEPPIPVELLAFGLASTLRRLPDVRLRGGPPSPDGGVIADWMAPVDDPHELAARLSTSIGVVEHGLFPPGMVSEVYVGRGDRVERFSPG